MIARIDSTGTNVTYYHFDAQHNTVALSNDTGVTDTYTYEPFGTQLKHRGNINQPFTFMGQFGVMQETPTMYYVRARYYDALNGRFLSKDPYPASLVDPQSMDKYVYSLNSPINKFDFTGLCVDTKNKFGTTLNKTDKLLGKLSDNYIYKVFIAPLGEFTSNNPKLDAIYKKLGTGFTFLELAANTATYINIAYKSKSGTLTEDEASDFLLKTQIESTVPPEVIKSTVQYGVQVWIPEAIDYSKNVLIPDLEETANWLGDELVYFSEYF